MRSPLYCGRSPGGAGVIRAKSAISPPGENSAHGMCANTGLATFVRARYPSSTVQ